MADPHVRFRLTADDKVSGPLDRLRGKFDALGKSGGAKSILQGVGLGVGAAAFSALAGAMDDVGAVAGTLIKGAIDEEAGVARLTTAIKENDRAWDGNVAAIEAVIKGRVALGFSDDEQRASLSTLTAVTQDHKKALDLQRTAMDLARLKGIDLQTATDLLGKVYSGNTGILRRYGIAIEKGATATKAIAAVQRIAAGQAEAYGDTTAGAMLGAQLALEDVGEAIATELLPVLKEAAFFVRDDVVPAVQDFHDVLVGVGHLLDGDFSPALDKADRALLDFVIGFGPFGEQLKTIFAEAYETVDERMADITDRSYDAIEDIRAARPVMASSTAEGMVEPYSDELDAMDEIARKAASDATIALQTGLRAGQDEVESALAALTDAFNDEVSRSARIAALEGQLAGSALASGLRSNDPLVREAASDYRDAIIAQLEKLRASAKTGGTNVAKSFADGLVSAAAISYAKAKAAALAGTVGDYFRGESPPKKGPLREIDKWGANVGMTWAESFAEGTDLADLLDRPRLPSAPRAGRGGGRSGGGEGLTFVYAPAYSTASPAEAQRFAASAGPHIIRWARQQGLSV
jgi:hypothetical protein